MSRRCGHVLWRGGRVRDHGRDRGHGNERERACGCCLRRGHECGGVGCCQRVGVFCRDRRGSWCGRARGHARGGVSVYRQEHGCRGHVRGRVCVSHCGCGLVLHPAGGASSLSLQPGQHGRQ